MVRCCNKLSEISPEGAKTAIAAAHFYGERNLIAHKMPIRDLKMVKRMLI